jgi:hypothetical protein
MAVVSGNPSYFPLIGREVQVILWTGGVNDTSIPQLRSQDKKRRPESRAVP